jgi:hypothetical protein
MAPDAAGSDASDPASKFAPVPAENGAGTVRCFVDPDQLHRQLTLMARAELVAMLISELAAGSPDQGSSPRP